jgi:hypothetical protein
VADGGFFAGARTTGGFAFHKAVATAIAGGTELESLEVFINAIASGLELGYCIGFNLPPFAGDA